MLIQVDHLGVFRNSFPASKLVIDELSTYRNVYLDSSTVFDRDIIMYAVNKMDDRILFGTDVPYVCDDNYMEKYCMMLNECGLNREILERIYYKNAEELLKKLNVC